MKINMACGWRNFGPDWVHIDGGDYEHLDYHSITSLELEDESIDLIYASHVLEYFDREEVLKTIEEWKRVLRPGAILRVAVPDFRALVGLYRNGTLALDQMLGPLYGKMAMSTQTIYHKTAYDYESLNKLLTECGFRDIKLYDWRKTEHAHFDDHSQAYIPHMDKEDGTLISLNVECIK